MTRSPARLPLDEGGESRVDFAFGAGLQNVEPHPFRPRGLLYVLDHDFHAGLFDSQVGRSPLSRNQLTQKL